MSSSQSPPSRFLRIALLPGAAFLFATAALRAQEVSGSGAASPADNAAAQSSPNGIEPVEPVEAAQPGLQGLERVNSLPPGAFGETPPGISYSNLLNSTGGTLNTSNILGGRPPGPNDWNSANPAGDGNPPHGNASLRLGGYPGFLVHAPEPEDADLKAGPVFIKFHSLDGLVLYDDNYNESEKDRKSELLALLRLNLSLIAQLSDNLQFILGGTIDYLPLQNQFGVNSGSDLLLLGPALAAQLVYDTVIAEWPVRFADDFQSGAGVFSNNVGDNFDLFEGDQLYRDQNGRYSFHDYQRTPSSLTTSNSPLIYYVNTVSALTDRLLPNDIRLTLRLEHQDLWYNQSNRGLPSSRDDFLATLASERENLRFKPYVTYEATYVDDTPGITQSINAGVRGPIDDQLFLRGEVGYFISGNGRNGVLYLLDLDHAAGPFTSEHLGVGSELNYFDSEQLTYEYYRFDQILGPNLSADFFLSRVTYQDLLNDGGPDFTDDLAGLQCTWNLGPRTTLYLGGIIERQEAYTEGRRDRRNGTHHLES